MNAARYRELNMRLTVLHAFAAFALVVPALADTELLVSQPQSKVTAPEKRSPGFLGKLGFDRQIAA
jgi:hypothetical protein